MDNICTIEKEGERKRNTKRQNEYEGHRSTELII